MRLVPRPLRWLVIAAALLLIAIVVVRAIDSLRGAPLEPWHTYTPHELDADALDHADWTAYLAAENRVMAEVRDHVVAQTPPEQQVAANRYFAGSPVNPFRFGVDWNRSFTLDPAGPPRGAVVVLHGLTDAPYSLRHVARLYQQAGFVVVAPRLPGHGTVPAGLTDVSWEDWLAATRLAIREARRRAGPDAPLHLVGYSNGGALAVMAAIEGLSSPLLGRPTRVVLLSPMIGVTRFARFAGLAGLPAFLPAFAKAAWLSVLPEYNPFKYNSFPVNAARQSHLLTSALRASIEAAARARHLQDMPPVLTFQSVLDFTVSTRSVVTDLYERLPRNGSELVLFDINRQANVGPLLRPSATTAVASLLPPTPRRYRTSVVSDTRSPDRQAFADVTEAGSTETTAHPLGLIYPVDVFSLSHIALPFPPSDGLYGTAPDPADNFGVQLGAIAARGERDALIIGLDTLMRMSSNPFFPYVAARIGETIEGQAPPAAPAR